jgi:hypothetical protein
MPALLWLAGGAFSALRFGTPSIITVHDFWTNGFEGFGDGRHALGKAEGAWVGTHDGGKTWQPQPELAMSLPDIGAVVLSADGQTMHTLGSVANVPNRSANYTSINASTAYYFTFANGTFAASERATVISFGGLPQPLTCGDASHAFGCPFRTSGRGSVRLADGTLLMSIIVYWGGQHANPHPVLAPVATSVIAFRSADGLSWHYAGTILDAAAAPDSEEGPNENDLALLPDGSVLAVVRLDAGDGRPDHPFRPYVRSVSTDGGRTWSRAQSLGDGVGCARPRLLSLGKAGGVVLSGGRVARGTWDNYVWHNAAADGVAWQAYSISYWHNRLMSNASLHFDASVNNSRERISTSYTSLVRTGPTSGFLTYSRDLPSPSVSFALPFAVAAV